jgi:uncharacterized protein (DUF2147 family)
MFRVVLAAFSGLCLTSVAVAGRGGDPTGVWLTQAGDARVRVTNCGQTLCGTIVGLKTPIDPTSGKPQVDDKNPDPRLKSRPVIGLQLFLEMKPVGDNRWSGHIYNSDDGRSYVSNVILQSPTNLKVEGCVGAFCGSEIWSRVR